MRELDLVLSYMAGRRLSPKDIQNALDMPKATYYSQRDDNRLASPANLIKLARSFNVNPVVLLVEYGHISADDVARYTEEAHPPEPAPDYTMNRVVNADSTIVLGDPVEVIAERGEVLMTARTRLAPRAAIDDVVVQRPRNERPTAEVGPQRIVLEIPASLGQTAISATELVAAIKQALDASFKELAEGQTVKMP